MVEFLKKSLQELYKKSQEYRHLVATQREMWGRSLGEVPREAEGIAQNLRAERRSNSLKNLTRGFGKIRKESCEKILEVFQKVFLKKFQKKKTWKKPCGRISRGILTCSIFSESLDGRKYLLGLGVLHQHGYQDFFLVKLALRIIIRRNVNILHHKLRVRTCSIIF